MRLAGIRVAESVGKPAARRNVTLGVPVPGGLRWLLVNGLPLPVGTAFAPNTQGARLVTTLREVAGPRTSPADA